MSLDTVFSSRSVWWFRPFRALVIALALAWTPGQVIAQVTVSMTGVVGAVGDELWVDIRLTNVDPALPIASFSMNVIPDDASVVVVDQNPTNAGCTPPQCDPFHDRAGTLTATSWNVSSNTVNGRLGGFNTAGSGIVANGTLVRFRLGLTAAVNTVVRLVDFRVSTIVNGARIDHSPDVPTVSVSVSLAGNRPPQADDDAYTVAEGGTLTRVAVGGVLTNDTDEDGQALAAALVTPPTNGTLTFNADGSFEYVHDGGESATDTFVYRASDGTLTDNGQVTITVTPVNDAPTAANLSTTARASVEKAITLSATDSDDTVFTFEIVDSPANGSVTIDGSTARYVANPGYTGIDSFTYIANDGELDSPAATVSLTVTGNTAPIGNADNYEVDEGGTVTVPAASGVLANDSDPDSDALTATLKTSVANGSLNFSPTGGFTYVHNGSETLFDGFTYTLSDGTVNLDVTVTIAVNPVDDPPVAVGGSATTQQGVPVDIPLTATDPDTNTLSYVLALMPIFGDVQIVGSIATYTPNPGFAGNDEFAFVANDGTSNSNIATVTVTVLGVARIQFVHNVADAVLDPADLYVDGVREWDNARFRTATPFEEMAAGRHVLAFAPGTSTSAATAIKTVEVDFANGEEYTVVVSGTIADDLFIVPLADARLTGTSASTVDIRVFNGSPDVPSLDVRWMADTKDHSFLFPFATALPYGTATAYTAQVPRAFNLEARPSSGTAIDTYRFDWTSRGGDALLLVASGLDAALGTNGFSLMTVDPNGSVGLPVVVTSSESGDLVPRTFVLRGNFPNPFNPTTMVQFDLPEAAEVSIRMTDLLGRQALTTPPETMDAGVSRSIHIDGSALSSGIYIFRVTARAGKTLYTAAGTMTLLK